MPDSIKFKIISTGATSRRGIHVADLREDGSLWIVSDAQTRTWDQVTPVITSDVVVVPPPVVVVPPVVVPVNTVNPTTFSTILAAAKGGETLVLAPGNYGVLDIRRKFTTPLTIKSADPLNPAKFIGLTIQSAGNVTIQGLSFKYTWLASHINAHKAFRIDTSEDIRVVGCTFVGDRSTVDGLPAADCLAIDDSKRVTVASSNIKTFRVGVKMLRGIDITITKNEISGNRSDGILVVSCIGVLIEDNYIHDFDRRVGNASDHCDMIQLWTNGTTIPNQNITIRGNRLHMGDGGHTQSIFMRNEEVDSGRSGLSMFYKNILIENNSIKNAHTHGITVGETDGLVIRNNTIDYVMNNHPVNVAYLVQWGAQAGVTVPKINVTDKALNVKIEGNVFSGAPWYTASRIT